MSLIVVTYSNMSEGLQEQKHLKDSCCNHQILPPNERQLKKLETWRIMYILQAAQQIILSRWVYWSKPLWGSWAGFCFFQEAGLLLEFSLQLCSSDSLLCSLAYLRVTLSRLYYTHWDWTESDKFQGLPEAILNSLPSVLLKSSPAEQAVSVTEETATQQQSTPKINTMSTISTHILVITLNISGLNSPINRHRLNELVCF